MNRLLLPALKLMNALSYVGKFLLITLIVCVPLVWLALDKVALLSTRIDTLEREQWGVSVMHGAWQYQTALSQMSNLQLVAKARNQADVVQLIEEQQISLVQMKAQLEQTLTAVPTTFELTDAQWHIDDELSLAQMYAQAGIPNDEFSERIHALLGGSLLLQDQDDLVFERLNEFSRTVQPIHAFINNVAAYDAFVTAYGFVETSAKPALEMLTDQLDMAQNADYTERVSNALSSSGQLYQAHIVEKFLSGSFSFDPNAADEWHANLQAYDEALGLLDQRVTQLLDEVDEHLQQRLAHAHSLLTGVIIILVAVLLGVLYFMVGFYRSVKLSIHGLMHSAEQFSKGDFSSPVQISSKDEIGALGQTFESMRVQISTLIQRISSHSSQAFEQAEQVSQKSGENLRSNETQTQQISQVLAPMSELVEGIINVANQAKQASQQIQQMQRDSSAGRQQIDLLLNKGHRLTQSVQQSTHSIKQVERETESIKDVLAVINGIAERTNLLALNAAIEAARAGEQGRGFAVVADEVRGLAQRVQESTNEIESSISSLTHKVDEAVSQMQQCQTLVEETMGFNQHINDAFQSINEALRSSASAVLAIEAVAEQQEMAAKTVDSAVSEIDQSGQALALIANSTNTSALGLKQASNQLQAELSRFIS